MGKVITIGLDIAKHVFQVHGVDAAGTVIVRQKLRRSDLLAFFERTEACLVGIQACATAHYWARSIMALGHRVKLMPPTYVKPQLRHDRCGRSTTASDVLGANSRHDNPQDG